MNDRAYYNHAKIIRKHDEIKDLLDFAKLGFIVVNDKVRLGTYPPSCCASDRSQAD